MIRIGERLRSFRVRARLSQHDLARAARVSAAKVTAWEGNVEMPDARQARRVAAALAADMSALFGCSLAASFAASLDEETDPLPGRPLAPRSARPLKGYGAPRAAALRGLRCGGCGRWVAPVGDGCRRCAPDAMDAGAPRGQHSVPDFFPARRGG